MPDAMTLHATSVAAAGKAVLIIGPSGAGKSSLALQLMALGAGLVADDRTQVVENDGVVIASVPAAIQGRIEARGVGLISVPHVGPTPISLVIDLTQKEVKRLPEPHTHCVLGIALPCLHNADSPHFAAAIWLSLQGSLDTTS